MLKIKMDIYHHRELREGKRRRRVVVGGNAPGEKKKMKNGCSERGGWGVEIEREGNRKQGKDW